MAMKAKRRKVKHITLQLGTNLKRTKCLLASEDADSAVFVDEDWLPQTTGSRMSLSRSSSQCSVCSCMACSQQATEWIRRPSRLLEGYDVEDFYRFDAVLGKNPSFYGTCNLWQ